MVMTSQRRYRIGLHYEYDLRFEMQKANSPWLSSEMAAKNLEFAGWRNSTKDELEAQLNRIQTSIEIAENKIKGIEDKFERQKQMQINSGHRPASSMNKQMRQDLHRFEAVLDVAIQERIKVEGVISERVEKQKFRKPCLPYGPVGMSKGNLQGIIKILDGQNVEQDTEGVLRICDLRSPYHSMKTVDYYEIMIPLERARQKQLLADLLMQAQAEARALEMPVPLDLGAQSLRRVDPKNLPLWPEEQIPRESVIWREKPVVAPRGGEYTADALEDVI